MVILLFFMESKFLDNNNGYCLRACVRKHSGSKFGLVWVGVRVDAQSINDDDDESGRPTTMTTTIPQSIDSWCPRKRVGVGEEGLRSLLRSPPRRADGEKERTMTGGDGRVEEWRVFLGTTYRRYFKITARRRRRRRTALDATEILYIYIYIQLLF